MTMFCLPLAATFGTGVSKALTSTFGFVAAKGPSHGIRQGCARRRLKDPRVLRGLGPSTQTGIGVMVFSFDFRIREAFRPPRPGRQLKRS